MRIIEGRGIVLHKTEALGIAVLAVIVWAVGAWTIGRWVVNLF